MGDNDHGALIIQQVVLQPLDRIEIQMVDRLIEQENVRRLKEQLAECHPGFLSAGKTVGRFPEFFLCKTQTLQYTGDLALPGIAAQPLIFLLCFMVLIHQKIQTVLGNSAHLPLHSPEAFFHINDFLLDLRCLVPDRPVAGECVDLCKISQRPAA